MLIMLKLYFNIMGMINFMLSRVEHETFYNPRACFHSFLDLCLFTWHLSLFSLYCKLWLITNIISLFCKIAFAKTFPPFCILTSYLATMAAFVRAQYFIRRQTELYLTHKTRYCNRVKSPKSDSNTLDCKLFTPRLYNPVYNFSFILI